MSRENTPPQLPTPGLGRITWWPMLLAPAALLACLALTPMDSLFQRLQNDLDALAPFLIGAVCAVYAAKFLLCRNPLMLLLATMAAAMTLREIHDLPGMRFIDKGIYVSLGLGAAWALLSHRRLEASLRADWRHASWLLVTFAAYFLAVLVARRAFRIVPGEHHIHRSLEECAETIAHGLFLLTGLLARLRGPGRAPAGSSPCSPAE